MPPFASERVVFLFKCLGKLPWSWKRPEAFTNNKVSLGARRCRAAGSSSVVSARVSVVSGPRSYPREERQPPVLCGEAGAAYRQRRLLGDPQRDDRDLRKRPEPKRDPPIAG